MTPDDYDTQADGNRAEIDWQAPWLNPPPRSTELSPRHTDATSTLDQAPTTSAIKRPVDLEHCGAPALDVPGSTFQQPSQFPHPYDKRQADVRREQDLAANDMRAHPLLTPATGEPSVSAPSSVT